MSGPIARTVEDLELAFQALAGADAGDPRAIIPQPLAAPGLPRRVAVCADAVALGVDSQVRAEIDKAASALADAGYEVEEAEPPRLADALTSYGTLITAEFGRRWPSIRRLLTEESAQHSTWSTRWRSVHRRIWTPTSRSRRPSSASCACGRPSPSATR